jgi:uncharacterized membrane protein
MTVETAPLPRPVKLPRAKYLLFAAIAVMYVYVLWTNEMFLVDHRDPEWQHIEPFKWFLLPHGLAAAFALLLGPLQFSERLRRKYITAHKVMGYLYIVGAYVGAPIGIYIQWFEEKLGEGTPSFTLATIMDASLWLLATTLALVFIRQKKMQQHRIWMTRSFACALIFLEVRLILTAFNLPSQKYAEMLVWACVAAAYPIGDLALQIEDTLKQRSRPRAV